MLIRLIQPALARLRGDLQLAIICFFGACAVFAIAPFAVYRFLAQEWLAGIVDLFLIVMILGTATYAWVSGDTRRAGLVAVLLSIGGCTAISFLAGLSGLFWMYPIFLASFFLVQRRIAVLCNILALLALSLNQTVFGSLLNQALFLVSASVVSIFAYIFAHLTEEQRERLEEVADLDPLTGIRNRRAMERDIHGAIAKHRSSQQKYCLLMLDIDHFKQINDRLGHEAGDQVLIATAKLLETHLRDGDRLYRFGGEEFVLLLAGTAEGGLRRTAERLQAVINEQLNPLQQTVTLSMGGAALEGGDDITSWLAKADAAMYQAKANGRNRAEFAQPTVAIPAH